MGTITIQGMKFFGYHGCHKEEQKIGNNYVVDVEIITDLLIPAVTDQLSDTIDYVKVHQIVENEIKITSRLLENVAHRIICRICGNFPNILQVKVRVTKLNPPIGREVEKVSVELVKDM